MKTESVLVRILRKSHTNASRLEKPVLRKKLTVLQSSFMDPEQFQAMKTPASLNFIRLLRVVITPSIKLRVNKIPAAETTTAAHEKPTDSPQ